MKDFLIEKIIYPVYTLALAIIFFFFWPIIGYVSGIIHLSRPIEESKANLFFAVFFQLVYAALLTSIGCFIYYLIITHL